MNSNKVALMVIAVVAIGIFALPTTLSLFAGQHVWYDISDDGNQVPCKKCHADIYEEYVLSANGVHGTLSGGNQTAAGDDPDAACGACHRLADITNPNAAMTFADGGPNGGSTPGEEAHAAAVISCMACHQLNNTGGYPAAGGFNITSFSGVTSPFVYTNASNPGTNAAHNAFIAEAIDDDTLQDSNEACLACHTMIGVKINWTHARSLEFDIDIGDPQTTDSGVHNWTMSNWAVNGTATATVWGNTTGAGSTNYSSDWPGELDSIYDFE
jgi:hypothetical protein